MFCFFVVYLVKTAVLVQFEFIIIFDAFRTVRKEKGRGRWGAKNWGNTFSTIFIRENALRT